MRCTIVLHMNLQLSIWAHLHCTVDTWALHAVWEQELFLLPAAVTHLLQLPHFTCMCIVLHYNWLPVHYTIMLQFI